MARPTPKGPKHVIGFSGTLFYTSQKRVQIGIDKALFAPCFGMGGGVVPCKRLNTGIREKAPSELRRIGAQS